MENVLEDNQMMWERVQKYRANYVLIDDHAAIFQRSVFELLLRFAEKLSDILLRELLLRKR